MEALTLKPERKAQLEEYAQRRGMALLDALDDLLAAQLEQETLDFKESLAAVRRGYADMKAGRTKQAAEFFAEVREKHGFPR